ncbi:MAG TPA: lysophospholipid acyltransferase family protein [Cyclobacteriaceae bacterium]|nr:lysophospholipid acyltransferase family protein [Cyclobacteriaceae bacterium]
MSGLKKIRKGVKYQLLYWLVKSLIFISNLPARRTWLNFCGYLGICYYRISSRTRGLVRRHLTLAFPEKSHGEVNELSKNVFKMLGKNAGEILRASKIETLDELERILVTEGYQNFVEANNKGRGVIFLTCHLGAFDLQVTNMALRGLNPNIIGTPLKDERLNDLLWKYRNQHGAIAIERGRETFRMIKVLRSGGSVALLIDQDTKVKSAFVNFFGMPASTPVGATMMAMKTGAAVVPTYVHLDRDGLQHMHILPEVVLRHSDNEEEDIIYNTQLLTTMIEGWIRKYPEQWVWMHERWKTKESI